MGSPLGPTICYYKDVWLHDCSLQCKPCSYKRYKDSIFALFESRVQVESFKMLNIPNRNLHSKKNRRDVSILVHNFKCNRCNTKYIGKTKPHYRTRTSKHIGVSPLTGKCVKINKLRILFCKTIVSPEEFSFLLKVHIILNLGFRKVF